MAKILGINLNNYSCGVVLTLLLVVPVSIFLSSSRREEAVKAETMGMGGATTEIFGVKIEKNPPQSKLHQLGVTKWPKWSCEPSKFPWIFKATETMYLLEGKVKVNVDGYEGCFEIGAGDLVVFPKGMKITWDVLESVSKHYSLEK